MKKHVVFVDDDRKEFEQFEGLYRGGASRLDVTAVHAQIPEEAEERIVCAASAKPADLFVLDYFFPSITDPPKSIPTAKRDRKSEEKESVAGHVQ